ITDYIHSASLNLSSTQARTTLAKHLAGRIRDRELDWPALVETAVVMVRNAYRAGEPAILLRDAPEPALGGAILPPIVATEGATLWYGDGGTGKSALALAAAASIHTGRGDVLGALQPATTLRTAFLDWEWTASVHRRRLARLWPDAELPDLMYVRCGLPLAQDVERLRRMVREHAIEFVVIDSVALAAGGDPERAETAIEFYGGLRQLEVDALLVAHVTKQTDGEKPFGSTFWHNSARSTWYIRKAQDAGSSSLRVAMVNKKANDAPLSLPIGLEIDHGLEATVIRRTELAADVDLAREVPLRLRIKQALLGGSLTYDELAESLDADRETVRRTVNRYTGKLFTTFPDGSGLRVGVLAHD
ncbi:MAG TPA: AAA family ATPase, partial [Candidatus Limnocylindrales bacterium]|nr:AAA family ATPase [Candidatus Limnocylindrales bacterium]